jgi:hypothetical protein
MNYLFGGLLAGCAALFIYAVAVLVPEDRARWEAFKLEYECHVETRVPASSHTQLVPSVGGNGQVTFVLATVFVPEKIGWRCLKDQKLYWR